MLRRNNSFGPERVLIVAVAWIYVALMMALAEATHPQGTLLGAIVTFLLYGVGPAALVVYLMGTPTRRRRARAREAASESAASLAAGAPGASSAAPDAGGEAAAGPVADAVAPVRKEP